MNNIMEYKGYVGSVEFSENDGVFYGKVQGIRSLISYEGTNAKELVSDFHGAVDDYLILCEEEGGRPDLRPLVQAFRGCKNREGMCEKVRDKGCGFFFIRRQNPFCMIHGNTSVSFYFSSSLRSSR